MFNMADTLGCLTKLRPFVRTFLRESSAMYRLCICTMGDSAYAHQMARLLDPDGAYFAPGDIVSKSDYTEKGQKGLDVLRGGDERTAIILDDKASVWGSHRANLVRMPGYHYFADSRRRFGLAGPSLAELGEDEDESTGALARALSLLRWTHRAFFDPEACRGGVPAARDVRDVLRGLICKKPEPPVAGTPLLRPQPVQVQAHQHQACES